MTTKEIRSVMRIEDIRLMEKFTFWLERLAILTQMFYLRLIGPQLVSFSCPKYLLLATALLLVVTNSIFLALSIERQFIRRFFFEPEEIFYIERPAILLLVLHNVVPGGYIFGAIIGLIVLVLTNYVMINCYFNSNKSQTNTTLHAKETRKDKGLKVKPLAETMATNILSSTELSGISESFCACDLDSKEKTEKDVEEEEQRIATDGDDQLKEEDKDACFEAVKKEDEVVAMEEDQVVKEPEADNQSWENVSDQNNESLDEEEDDVSSWEESDDDDESSWEETNGELGKETEYEDEEENINFSRQQEKKKLAEKLELATQKWMKYKKDCSILAYFLNVDLNLSNNVNADELEKLKQEKDELETKLGYAYKFMEDERKIREERIQVLRNHLTIALDAIQGSMEQDFEEERRKWEDEKIALYFTVSNADKKVQNCQTLVNTFSLWYQSSINGFIAERNELSSNLVAVNTSSESYKAKLDQSEEHCLYYKTCFEEYEEKCQKLKEENLNLVSKINTETSFAQQYKRYAGELEEKCRKLEEEKTDLTAKFCAAKALSQLYRACMHDIGDLDS